MIANFDEKSNRVCRTPAVLYLYANDTTIALCPRCGATSKRRGEGKGPHVARLECGTCGRFIRWISKREAQQGGV